MATSEVSVLGRGRSVVTSGSLMVTSPDAERKTLRQMPVSRSRMAGIQSQPMVERKVGPSMAVMPPLPPMPALAVCSSAERRDEGLRGYEDCDDGLPVWDGRER